MTYTSFSPGLSCALHGHAFTHGCPGCAVVENISIAAVVRERMANDTGERITLEELADELGFDLDELRAEVDAEDSGV